MYLIDNQYLPPISYISNLYKYSNIKIVEYENFRKATFRNRCIILGSNGPIHLSIPIRSGRAQRKPFKEIEISYDTDWQTRHWRSIQACYSRSPFGEFYEMAFHKMITRKEKFLFDYNWYILEKLTQILQIPMPSRLKEEPLEGMDWQDGRDIYTPKNFQQAVIASPYFQVFEEKTGFVPNLSILDLICNLGPGCSAYFNNNA